MRKEAFVKVLAASAFTNLGIEEIVFPDSLNGIGDSAFEGCAALKRVTLGNSLKTIGSFAFHSCVWLTKIILPSSVTNIGDSAFGNCYRLAEIYNLSNIAIKRGSTDNGQIGFKAKAIYASKDEQSRLFVSDGDFLFYANGNETYLLGYTGTDTDLRLPENYNGTPYDINDGAFYACNELTNITIPEGTAHIGEKAFFGCNRLTSILIPGSMAVVGSWCV